MNIQSVILAGGSGTRLWPLSRSSHPKQFLPFMEGASLLDLTLSRMVAIAPYEFQHQPLVICNQDNRFFVAEHLRQAGIKNRLSWLQITKGFCNKLRGAIATIRLSVKSSKEVPPINGRNCLG